MKNIKDMIETVDINTVFTNEDNPRILKDDKFKKLVKSVKEFPQMLQIRPIVVNAENIVLGGNMRLQACKKAGLKEVTIIKADNLTEEQQKEFIIKDNVGFGEWDWDMIANEWDVEQVEEWGLDVPEWDNGEELEAEEDEFDVPDGGIETDIVVGDLFEIGEHRLLCGDSTDSDAVASLMNGEKADIAFTSPPYNTKENAKLSPHQKNGSKYNSYTDDLEDDDYLKLLTGFTNNTLINSDYSFVNIQSLSGNKTALIDFLFQMKEVYADTLIWNKLQAQPAMANNVLNSQYEYVHCFSSKANRAIGVKEFRGTLSNVLDIPKQSNNKVKEHNATFPIDFAGFFVSNFSLNSVLDLFLGSGTTMVAAHQLKRKCYGMELDPKYCQVIVDRMLKLDPTLEVKRNGVKYEPKTVE
jgi:DNA modification methylase